MWALLVVGASWSSVGYSQTVESNANVEEDANRGLIEATSNDLPRLDRVLVRQGITATSQLDPWKPLRKRELLGQVEDLDAKELTMVVQGQSEHPRSLRIPSGQLMAIFPVWQGEGTAELVKLFERQRYQEFVLALQQHDRSQIPPWQQLLLLEMVVRAIDAVQGPAASGQHFLTLAQAAPEMLYAHMPLCWTVSEPSADLIRKSRQWLDSDDEVAQLLGASWLLQGPDSTQAREVILRLKNSRNAAVAQLASAQSWRLTPPPETMSLLNGWLVERDRMLPSLAIGPTEFLADRLARIGKSDLAVVQWIWIASGHPQRHNKATRALQSAENLMRTSGRLNEADRIASWLQTLHGSSE